MRTDADFAAEPSIARTVLVTWQDPESHAFIKVGQLDQLPDSRY